MAADKDKTVAIISLLTGAVVWGLAWYPYRVFEMAGLRGLQATMLTYLVALLLGVGLLHRHVTTMMREGTFTWRLVLIGLAAGACNLGYVLATLQGEVMRVLLLFYLAPLWTVFWSYLLLGERLNRAGLAVVALSVAGAATMLWHPELGAPWPATGAEWLGLAAGFLFAFSNVMVRQVAQLPVEVKSLAVYLGVVLLGAMILPFDAAGSASWSGTMQPWHWLMLVLVGVTLMVVNLVVQHGLSHTSANQAIVIFLFELVVAAISSWLLAHEVMGLREWMGGAMIIAASLFSGALGEHEAEIGTESLRADAICHEAQAGMAEGAEGAESSGVSRNWA